MKTKFILFASLFLFISAVLFSCQKQEEDEADPEFQYIPFKIDFTGYCGVKPSTELDGVATDKYDNGNGTYDIDYATVKKAGKSGILVEMWWILKNGNGSKSVYNDIKKIDGIWHVKVPKGKKYFIDVTYVTKCRTCLPLPNEMIQELYKTYTKGPHDESTTSITKVLNTGNSIFCSQIFQH